MKQDIFTKLPSDITIDILLRLPFRTIGRCKCVCKSLLILIGTLEFAESYIPKATPGLAILQTRLIHGFVKNFKIYEVNDVLHLEGHELHFHRLTEFSPPFPGWIHGSVNGLLFLNSARFYDGPYICNPVTREYIKLHCPPELSPPYRYVSSGFGASKMTNQYKVVVISYDWKHDSKQSEFGSVPKVECLVYTLGTRSWRRIEHVTPCKYGGWGIGVFVNNNLHWLVYDSKGTLVISCFDLETELFSSLSVPPLPRQRECRLIFTALNGCLCLSNYSSHSIWVMKEYGVEKSWTEENVIRKWPHFGEYSAHVPPIKVFEDGDDYNKTNSRREIDLFTLRKCNSVDSIFLSLKSFPMENVGSI